MLYPPSITITNRSLSTKRLRSPSKSTPLKSKPGETWDGVESGGELPIRYVQAASGEMNDYQPHVERSEPGGLFKNNNLKEPLLKFKLFLVNFLVTKLNPIKLFFI